MAYGACVALRNAVLRNERNRWCSAALYFTIWDAIWLREKVAIAERPQARLTIE
jgi:hypothetical protein